MQKIVLNYLNNISDNNKILNLLFGTIGNILLKQDNINLFIKENHDKIIHIRDWISSVVQDNKEWKTPRVLTIDALNNAANKYFKKKNNELQTIELDETHEKLIADLGEYYLVQMLTPEALDNESKVMQHCIGHGRYDENLKYPDYQYLSLRDKFNKAHVTMEIENKKILQLQGKQNEDPEQKYLEKLLPWLIDNGYKNNLKNYQYFLNKNDNKFYSAYNMPDNCEIDGDLYLHHSNIKLLPKNLVVNGNLGFYHCHNLEKLPENLTVNGHVYLYKCNSFNSFSNNISVINLSILNIPNIKVIPDDFKINGDLDLECCSIEQLPNVFHIDNLYIDECIKLKKIPEILHVKNKLIFGYINIEKFSDDLKCKILHVENIKFLFKNKHINFDSLVYYNHKLEKKEIYTKSEFYEQNTLTI